MSIWNKVLLALIFLASLAMLALGARALKTHQYWRELAARHEAAIAEQQLRARLLRGTATKQEIEEARKKGELPPNLRELEIQVHSALLARGPAWYGCIPQRVDPQSGQVTPLERRLKHARLSAAGETWALLAVAGRSKADCMQFRARCHAPGFSASAKKRRPP